MARLYLILFVCSFASSAFAKTLEISYQTVTEWKPVYGQIETRDRVPARARIGGTIVALDLTEGDEVRSGGRVALIEDPKLTFQIDSLNARLDALASRLETARSELARGEELIGRGVITSQRFEELQTAVSVLEGEITSFEAERLVIERQIEEGAVLSPENGIVLSVPISAGSVVTPGEAVAVVGGGGVFLRLSIPERHAADLSEGDVIEIGTAGELRQGTLAKLYPQIEGGRVQADVDVAGLEPDFIGRRLLVRLPVGERQAILVPEAALSRHGGLDFVTVETDDGPVQRVVVPGGALQQDGIQFREILTGLSAGEMVVTRNE